MVSRRGSKGTEEPQPKRKWISRPGPDAQQKSPVMLLPHASYKKYSDILSLRLRQELKLERTNLERRAFIHINNKECNGLGSRPADTR